MLLCTPNMSASTEYSLYTNVTSIMGFFDAIYHNLNLLLISDVKCCPIYLILIDESTNQKCEPHFILYVFYLKSVGSGLSCL